MSKWFSRKFFVCLFLIILSSVLLFYNKITPTVWAIVSITAAVIYLFVNGAVALENLKIAREGLVIEMKKEEEENEKN